jgi:hypothetical protein
LNAPTLAAQEAFEQYLTMHGRPPSQNVFEQLVFGVLSRDQARAQFHILRTQSIPTGEPMMQNDQASDQISALETLDAQIRTLQAQLGQQSARITALMRQGQATETAHAEVEQRLAALEPCVAFLEEIFRSATSDDHRWQGIVQLVNTLEPTQNGKGPLMKRVAQLCQRPFKLY